MGTQGLGARLCRHNDGGKSFPRPSATLLSSELGRTPGELSTHLGERRCLWCQGRGQTCPSRVPAVPGGRRTALRILRPEGERSSGTASTGRLLPGTATIGTSEGTSHLGRVPGCPPAPRLPAPRDAAAATRGTASIPAAGMGIPDPPAFVSSGAHGKWGRAALPSPPIPAKATGK